MSRNDGSEVRARGKEYWANVRHLAAASVSGEATSNVAAASKDPDYIDDESSHDSSEDDDENVTPKKRKQQKRSKGKKTAPKRKAINELDKPSKRAKIAAAKSNTGIDDEDESSDVMEVAPLHRSMHFDMNKDSFPGFREATQDLLKNINSQLRDVQNDIKKVISIVAPDGECPAPRFPSRGGNKKGVVNSHEEISLVKALTNWDVTAQNDFKLILNEKMRSGTYQFDVVRRREKETLDSILKRDEPLSKRLDETKVKIQNTFSGQAMNVFQKIYSQKVDEVEEYLAFLKGNFESIKKEILQQSSSSLMKLGDSQKIISSVFDVDKIVDESATMAFNFIKAAITDTSQLSRTKTIEDRKMVLRRVMGCVKDEDIDEFVQHCWQNWNAEFLFVLVACKDHGRFDAVYSSWTEQNATLSPDEIYAIEGDMIVPRKPFTWVCLRL